MTNNLNMIKSLNLKNFRPLMEKITERIRSWTSKNLSFASMMVLTEKVCESLHSYRCRIFPLLVHLLQYVDRLGRAFHGQVVTLNLTEIWFLGSQFVAL